MRVSFFRRCVSFCGRMKHFVFCKRTDETMTGPYLLTLRPARRILRGSEIFGYDENKYPGGGLQRAAGRCKAVHEPRGKILSELPGGTDVCASQ